jgi:hypothetical protein
VSDTSTSERPLIDRLRRRIYHRVTVPLERRVLAPLRRLRNARREYRPVFVAGAMGSGTTLLAFSLGQHFRCASVIEESAMQVAPDSFLHVPHPDRFDSIRAYQDYFAPQPSWSVELGRRNLLDMYRSFAVGDSDLVFDKGPNVHLERAAFLARCFPHAHHVMIFRDPVVNIEGFRRKWVRFGEDTLEENIRFYRSTHERFLDVAEGLGDRVHVVEYERFVNHTEAMLAVLRERLGLEDAPSLRRLPTRANVEGQGIRNVSGGRIGVVRSANERSYQRLPEQTIEAIQGALGSLHQRMRSLALEPSTPD